MLKKQWEEPVANVIQNEVQLEIGGVDLDRGSHDDLKAKPEVQYGFDPQKNKTKKNALNNFLRSLALFKHDFYVISSKKQRMNLTWDSKLDKFLKDLQRYLDPKLPVH